MRVLFVNSANSRGAISPIVLAQGESLKQKGIIVDYYPIQGKGVIGYLRNISSLKFKIKEFQPDIIHAHYSLSGFLVSLCTSKPIVVSIMGSFPKTTLKLFSVKFFSNYIWQTTIVKSFRTKDQLGLQNVKVFPNGVDLSVFYPIDKFTARHELGLIQNVNLKYVLFAADINREEKNFALASLAVEALESGNVKLLTIMDVEQAILSKYLSAVDVLILTSTKEGSPNIIKEAMACNCPILTSNVGDVERTIGHTDGCKIVNGYNYLDYRNALSELLSYNSRTLGRERIIELELDSSLVADSLVSLYNDSISKTKK